MSGEHDFDEPTDPSLPAVIDATGAPPMLARIADVEPYEAPFEPPPGALKKPSAAAPVWSSRAGETGRLVAPEDVRPVAPTLELPLPESAREDDARDTAEVAMPEARAPRSAPPVVQRSARASSVHFEQTAVLPEVQPAPPPVRRSMYDEPTVLLPETLSARAAAMGDDPDETTSVTPPEALDLAAVPPEALFVDEGTTYVLSGDELVEIDDDDDEG